MAYLRADLRAEILLQGSCGGAGQLLARDIYQSAHLHQPQMQPCTTLRHEGLQVGDCARQSAGRQICATQGAQATPIHLGGADRVEQDGRGFGQHHVPEVGVRQRAAPQQQAHEVGGVRDARRRQLLAQRRVHAVAHHLHTAREILLHPQLIHNSCCMSERQRRPSLPQACITSRVTLPVSRAICSSKSKLYSRRVADVPA